MNGDPMNDVLRLSYNLDGEVATEMPKDIDKYRRWVIESIAEGNTESAEYWTKALIDLIRRFAIFQIELLRREW